MTWISLRRSGAGVVLSLALAACGGGTTPAPTPPSAPGVAGVAPTSGPARGGTAFTITGSGFAAGATVTIDGLPVSGASVASATTITGTTPAHGAGSAAIVVKNPDGRSSSGTTAFTYVAAPVVASVSPGIVPTAGQAVVIQGANFVSPVQVRFGGALGANATVVSPTQVAATAPAHASGLVDVVVQNADGQQAVLASAVNYSDAPSPTPTGSPPALATVTPASGVDTGGTAVTLTGANFDASTTATFGGVPASVVGVSATSLSVVAPPHGDGAVDVSVVNAAGQATLAGAYAYVAPPAVTPPPVLSAVTPAQGVATGGTTVTLTGSAFNQPTVKFGAAPASVLSSSPTSIGVTSPAGSGTVAVTVTNVDGQSSTLASAFAYTTPPPAIAGLSPTSGPANTTTAVTIAGSGFAAGATVKFGATPATNVNVASATAITVTSPALAAGTVDVVVTNPDQQTSNAAPFAFTPVGVIPAPSISGMAPTTAVITGGQAFTITGSNLAAGATVTFAGAPAGNLVVSNVGTSITGIIPAGAAGRAPVVVRNVDGQTAAFNGFSYVNQPPVILALNVEGAPVTGGAIFVAGTGFSPSATVAFNGVRSPSVVQDPGTGGLTVQVPAYTGALDPVTGNDAFVPLVVTNPDTQSVTWSKQFHYGPPPSVTSIADQGPGTLAAVKRGDAIAVTGAHFSADATGARAGLQVFVAGTICTITSKSATQIVFTAPKANPGTYPVVVTNFDTQSTITVFPNVLTYPGP